MIWADAEHTAIRDGGRMVPADPSIPEFAAIDISQVAEYVPPPPSMAEYRTAIDAHVEAVARSRDYDSATALASYTVSTVPAWADEAQAFVAWRDQVWTHALGLLAAVQAGQQAPTAVADVIAGLPSITWPDAST